MEYIPKEFASDMKLIALGALQGQMEQLVETSDWGWQEWWFQLIHFERTKF